MGEFIISTTPVLEGYRVVKYLGPVVVPTVGAGDVIKDWLAGWTDLFGGKSTTYRKVFEKFIGQGVKELIATSKEHGANAIVNLRIEPTNVTTAKDKSVVLVMMYGTAVIAEPHAQGENGGVDKDG